MTRSLEDDLVYPLTGQLDDGAVLAVEPGLLWVRLPLPYRLNHVNVWAIEEPGGWTIVDTGLDDARTRAIWEGLLAGPLGGRPVARVIATHFHPDHIGLAGWLVEHTGASFSGSLTDWLYARALCAGTSPAQTAAVEAFYRRAGVDDGTLKAILGRGDSYARSVHALPPTLVRLRHGDRPVIGGSSWRVIVGSGHTPEQVCLFRPDKPLLISADQVLPRISPNVSVWPAEPDADPLSDFLASFESLLELPEDVLVLPSHGKPFRGLHRRIAWLRAHHEERLHEIEALCETPRTATQVADALFGKGLDTHQTVFAVGEAVAHLNHLIRRGALTRRSNPPGADLYARTEN
ncbi:MBL fold metallo-hydrolase [Azospirillum sp. sgz302134]